MFQCYLKMTTGSVLKHEYYYRYNFHNFISSTGNVCDNDWTDSKSLSNLLCNYHKCVEDD